MHGNSLALRLARRPKRHDLFASLVAGGLLVICGTASGDLIVEGANSPFSLSSGTLTNGQTTVGKTGAGVFNHSGGTNNAGVLILGDAPGSSGTYNLGVPNGFPEPLLTVTSATV